MHGPRSPLHVIFGGGTVAGCGLDYSVKTSQHAQRTAVYLAISDVIHNDQRGYARSLAWYFHTCGF